MLVVCLVISLFSTMTAGAATEINNVVLTGDITPKAGQTMKFAATENNPNYTVIQATHIGAEMITNRGNILKAASQQRWVRNII